MDSLLTLLGERKKIRIMLLAGGDLIASFGHPGVWATEDVSVIQDLKKLLTKTSYITSWVVMDV